jgi:hypothetical protein
MGITVASLQANGKEILTIYNCIWTVNIPCLWVEEEWASGYGQCQGLGMCSYSYLPLTEVLPY